LAVPATTAATEPVLDGVAVHDALLPFTIRAAGAPLCRGQLQDRVVRSSRTGLLHFSYAIRTISGSESIARIVAGESDLASRQEYRENPIDNRALRPFEQVVTNSMSWSGSGKTTAKSSSDAAYIWMRRVLCAVDDLSILNVQ